jgi:hypothetical protein
VNAGASTSSIDHEGILDKRFGGIERLGALLRGRKAAAGGGFLC